ncbi:hypothetical protein EJK15_28105 [Nonomuraea basaltis]|nr:hypothetical protein EJK15_28105 [Nonomuraea basaltis]
MAAAAPAHAAGAPEPVTGEPAPAPGTEEPAAGAIAAEHTPGPVAEPAPPFAAGPAADEAEPAAEEPAQAAHAMGAAEAAQAMEPAEGTDAVEGAAALEGEQPAPHEAVASHEGAPSEAVPGAEGELKAVAPDEGQSEAVAPDEGQSEAVAPGQSGLEPDARQDAVPHEAVAEEGVPEGAEPVLDADAEPAAEEGDGPEPVLHAADEPAPEPAAEEAAALAEGALAQGAPAEATPAEGAGVPQGAPAEGAGVPQESAEAEREGVSSGAPQELPQLIEAAFAGLDDKSWAVAQNRVFTDEPSAVDQLAKLFAVPPAEISATEDEFRARLGQWLASEEAAPYRAHLDELRKTLGPAAPKEQLIGAADWHNLEIRALEVPAWQFVLATLSPQPDQSFQPQPQADRSLQLQPQVDLPPPPQPQIDLPPPPNSAFGPGPLPPPPGPPQFQAFMPVAPPAGEANGGAEEHKPYQPLKDVSQTRRCFRQPDGRWWLRIDVTAEQLAGGECALPTGFASYLGLSPGESRTVRSAAGELTMTWHGRPVLESIERLLVDVGAREGGHLFLTLSDEGVLRARHLPVAAQGAEKITKALRLVGYTAPGGTRDQAARVIATRIGMTGPVSLPDLLTRLRERGDRDLLALLD